MITSRIRIKLQSFNHESLNSSCNKLKSKLKDFALHSFRIISLPTQKRIYCVLRSPHVDNDSREHFEIRIHKKLLQISYDSEESDNIFNLLSKTKLSPGVMCKLKF